MTKRWVAGLLGLALVAGIGGAAAADSLSMVTGAVGSQLGLTHATQLDGSSDDRFVSELNIRGKFFTVIGLEFAYNPAATDFTGEQLIFHSRLRLAGQIYFLPLDEMSMYLTAGIGADGFSGLFSITEDTNSYHGGLGAEVYIDSNIAVAAEYLMIIPGIRSIQRTVVKQALHSALGSGDEPAAFDVQKLSAGDFISPGNFQLTVGARYYF